MEFAYDYAGRRVEKTVSTWNGSGWTPTSGRRFVYDGWNLLVELDALSPSTLPLTRSYTWGLDNGGSLTTSSSPGSLLRITNYSSGTPGTSYYPTYDDQGNVASLVNATSGALAAVYEYDPYGNLIRNEVLDSAMAENPFRHSTKYHDVETGLVYYGYRYYDPKHGRFINQDPIGVAGGLNLYGFCGNDGINQADHLGLIVIDININFGGDDGDDLSFGWFNGWNLFGIYQPGTPADDLNGLGRWGFNGTSWIYWVYLGDERTNTQPPPETTTNTGGGRRTPTEQPPGPETGGTTTGATTTSVGGATVETGGTPSSGTGNTGDTNVVTTPVTPVNPQPPSSAPASVGFASGSMPRMPGERTEADYDFEDPTKVALGAARAAFRGLKGAGLVVGGLIPGIGDALDIYTVVARDSSTADRVISGVSLGVNAVTAGMAPNAGPILSGLKMILGGADEASEAGKAVSKSSRKWPKHHPWPQYLGGLRDQTLKKLPLSRHKQFHKDLDEWKGGKYAKWKGAKEFEDMDPEEIINDLRDFYRNYGNGKYRDLLPDLEQAINETLKATN